MPAWKTVDEKTAEKIRGQVPGEPAVYVDPKSTAMDGNDAVILAPTANRGVTMLITVRRKAEPVPSVVIPSKPIPEVVSETAEVSAEVLPSPAIPETVTSVSADDQFFGPTNWRNIEQFDSDGEQFEPNEEEAPPVSSFEPVNPEVVVTPAQSEFAAPAERLPDQPPVASRRVPEKHYVATGFLGLDEVAEDEEDLARQKRPWWKRIFLD